jgi:hypothetical protein
VTQNIKVSSSVSQHVSVADGIPLGFLGHEVTRLDSIWLDFHILNCTFENTPCVYGAYKKDVFITQ